MDDCYFPNAEEESVGRGQNRQVTHAIQRSRKRANARRCEADLLTLEDRIRQHRKRVVKEEREWLREEARSARSLRA